MLDIHVNRQDSETHLVDRWEGRLPSDTTGQQTVLFPRPAGEAEMGEGLEQPQEFKPCG